MSVARTAFVLSPFVFVEEYDSLIGFEGYL